MEQLQATGIQIHLITGHKRRFYQEDPALVANICGNLDGHIFSQDRLVVDSADEATSFPGSAILGITILTEPLPESFFEAERRSKVLARQLSYEAFELKRIQNVTNGLEGPLTTISEIVFVSGEHLYLEAAVHPDVVVDTDERRFLLKHLFASRSLLCRRIDGGYSIWNTGHIVSSSVCPKPDASPNAWMADPLGASDQDSERVSIVA